MPTALEFLTEFAKELIHCDPLQRQIIVAGYARHLEAREEALKGELSHV